MGWLQQWQSVGVRLSAAVLSTETAVFEIRCDAALHASLLTATQTTSAAITAPQGHCLLPAPSPVDTVFLTTVHSASF